MELKENIKIQYKALAEELEVPLTRDNFRKYGTYICSTSLIDKLWGSWSNFTAELNETISKGRGNVNIQKTTSADKVVITSVTDGTTINKDCLKTLINYAKQTNSELYILWGEPVKPNTYFSLEDYNLIKPYLCTELTFDKDKSCIATDIHIKPQARDPLMNLERIFSDSLSHVVVASPKQYQKMLPYECNKTPRQAWSTGTISNIDYKPGVNGQLNKDNVTLGGVVAYYNASLGYYQIRNLVFDGTGIYDINQYYKKTGTPSFVASVPAIVLGDLHLPEEDAEAIDTSIGLINTCNAEKVFLHDWCSFNSINHHEENKYLDKILNITPENITLDQELTISTQRLDAIIDDCPKAQFYIVASNHDNFVSKWLNEGLFIKDRLNARIGAELFIKCLDYKPILEGWLRNEKRVHFMEHKESFEVCGFEVAAHGHEGIAGAKGSVKSFVRTFNKSVSGHTHSPQIFESAVVVGTNSELNLPYTGKISNWGQSNVIIHKNGTIQQIFCS